MAYKKHVWENGQIITKEKLNNIQDGIAALDGGSSGGGGELAILDWSDLNNYSDTIDGRVFNSETDSLRIGDGLYAPYTYWFIDSLDVPFAMSTAYPPGQGETQTITVTNLYTFFETTENYQAAVSSGDFYLAHADKIIKVKESSSDTELSLIIIVGSFEIAYVLS